ncbi:hypothetical protein B9Z19DRAFT_1062339 [Tuber borchii]|uniref:Uncharacterized protein n=1 Tax=Tuber borchii TaxID=42251 RepID=A0A2T7A289_TUBBO|nr:hypothetical protein B9Z19DRAFT_1062339 [Tuber borchii]
MRHVKPSEAQIAAFSTALGKEGCGWPSDCDNSSAGGVIYWKEVRKEYYAPGMHLEFKKRDGEDPEWACSSRKRGGGDGMWGLMATTTWVRMEKRNKVFAFPRGRPEKV